MEPPHRCSELKCRLACQGNWPGTETLPPTIRVLKRGRRPHSGDAAHAHQTEKKDDVAARRAGLFDLVSIETMRGGSCSFPCAPSV